MKIGDFIRQKPGHVEWYWAGEDTKKVSRQLHAAAHQDNGKIACEACICVYPKRPEESHKMVRAVVIKSGGEEQ